ncbi:hypothetical protein SmaMPs15_000080 [Stenotrophomonas maltophilia phage vB_SmaM_Ps15]|uniref:Uncharacterized protein n=1 Tax=Stenotrophomonas maltophilia phage vB_SmaM_Ps15 TaxID=3071007 RepID=A0AAE9FML5_9CAUD|nr:hypothetical protein PQC01_gp080 [Stenotrophomonas maltophilia phage vB_SmaM_Ps15]UMO77231.1 hypothetical protein SmaMPs15_000080 [Stenotrophomonas maltophilia phage vB_SmaM_Ps15]
MKFNYKGWKVSLNLYPDETVFPAIRPNDPYAVDHWVGYTCGLSMAKDHKCGLLYSNSCDLFLGVPVIFIKALWQIYTHAKSNL